MKFTFLSFHEGKQKENHGKLIQFPVVCVGYELSSRAVSSQVFSPLQRLTSVFGMGTGGPTALKTLTTLSSTVSLLPSPSGYAIKRLLSMPELLGVGTADWCTSGDSNPGPTD